MEETERKKEREREEGEKEIKTYYLSLNQTYSNDCSC